MKRRWLYQWRRLSITLKYALAFGAMLLLMFGVALTGYFSLVAVRQQQENTITTSYALQRFALQMDATLEQVHRLEREFFLFYPRVGFDEALQLYAASSLRAMEQLLEDNEQLQQGLAQHGDRQLTLRRATADLEIDLEAVAIAGEHYQSLFTEAIGLVEAIHHSEHGLLTDLATNEAQLRQALAQDNSATQQLNALVIALQRYRLYSYRPYMEQVQAHLDWLEQHYRQGRGTDIVADTVTDSTTAMLGRDSILSISNAATSPTSNTAMSDVQSLLEHYRQDSRSLLDKQQSIAAIMDEMSLFLDVIALIAQRLNNVALQEVQIAEAAIYRRFQMSVTLLAVSLLAASLFALAIARAFNRDITQNILKLTHNTQALQQEGQQASAVYSDIDRKDEIGILARNFNRMARRIRQTMEQLEQRVAERTQALLEANQQIRGLNDQLHAENMRMGSELAITKRIQKMMLPSSQELQHIEYLDIAAYVEAANEVGGDYYDVLQHSDHQGQQGLKIGIGDVTGHGLDSGLLMLMTQTAVRTLLNASPEKLPNFLSILNRTLYDNMQRMQFDKSLSLALLDYQPPSASQSKAVLRCSGQHESLLLCRRDGHIEALDTIDWGFPLGLVEDISDFVAEHMLLLEPGDGVVLYTDGITEAENMAQEQYGLERLILVLRQHWQEGSNTLCQHIIDDLYSHIGTQKVHDDITLLILKQR